MASSYSASVCTGAFLLAERGLLDGRRATTHWASVDWMREEYPRVTMLSDTRFVDEGDVITSAGASAGNPADWLLHTAIYRASRSRLLASLIEPT